MRKTKDQNEEKENLKKLIYFDEDSATDLILVNNGGQLEEVFKKDTGNSSDTAMNIAGAADTNFNLISIIKARLSGDVNFSYNKQNDKLFSQVMMNTVITDYLNISDDENIIKFKDDVVYAYPNSLSYFKLLTPYMAMTEGKMNVDSNFSINISLMDTALEQAKGYYEMLINQDGTKSILRFNLMAFRNNYSLADLVKMKLTFHGVEVGSIPEEMLDIEKEFSLNNNEISGYDITDNGENENKVSHLKVYDVILAGVFK